MEKIIRVNVLGVGISAISMVDAVHYSDKFLQNGARGYICVTGVHGIMEAQADEQFRHILNSSFLTTPDGKPTVWIGHWQGHTNMTRVYGPDFMLELCRLSVDRGYKHFLYGGKPGIAEALREKLILRYPGLQIVGTYTPPFRPLTSQEEIELEEQLLEAKPNVLWCGLSTPKQEWFMARYTDKLPVKLMVGVGAAFDINSGNLKDAPQWMKDAGLQWLYRMFQEPRRLAVRYLANNPRFLWLLGLQMIGLRKYSIPAPAQNPKPANHDEGAPPLGQRFGSRSSNY
jgi:N-acetylglucosaminyldiphosphoundecaprenol N-acetyl-beta-D-mannosaminyltransferase